MNTITTIIYYAFWLLINEIRLPNFLSHHFKQILMKNLLIYSKYDPIQFYDVIDIKICWCKQLCINSIWNENSLQNKANGVYNFTFNATMKKITEDLRFSSRLVTIQGHVEVTWHNNKQWNVDNYIAYQIHLKSRSFKVTFSWLRFYLKKSR